MRLELLYTSTLFYSICNGRANKEAGISPGKYTEIYAQKQLKRRLHRYEMNKLPSTELRRLQLKKARSNMQCANEIMEADTYASGIFIDIFCKLNEM